METSNWQSPNSYHIFKFLVRQLMGLSISQGPLQNTVNKSQVVLNMPCYLAQDK